MSFTGFRFSMFVYFFASYLQAVGADYGLPCSDIYPGERPFSEVETRNLAVYMFSIRRRIKAYVDLHSYGQMWMSPWGFKRDFPPSYREQVRAKLLSFVLSMHKVFDSNFTSTAKDCS